MDQIHVQGVIGEFGEPEKLQIVEPFTPVQAGAVNSAMINLREASTRLRGKGRTAAANSFEHLAGELLVVRNMILDRLPEEFHEHRKAYPDYRG